MSSPEEVPQELNAFLRWLKDRTEAVWAEIEMLTFEQYQAARVGSRQWRTGTMWQSGLTASEIDAIETRWDIRFPEDYRCFLSVLNAPDLQMHGTGFDGDTLVEVDRPSFYDWRGDEVHIASALEWPLEGLLFDVKHNALWRDSWGKRPNSENLRKSRLEELVAAAPKLVPIFSHRYLVSHKCECGYPVLSVYQSDIILYGLNLRAYLLAELRGVLGKGPDYSDNVEEFVTDEELEAIPFWGEFIE